jgi:putative nucleotidyltransferase with HDIG domain
MSEAAHEYKKKYHILKLNLSKELAHGICVSNLACRIGRELQLPKTQCYDLAVAGFLHDIGKLEIWKYIVGHEEDTLTIEEMKYVRWHASFGAGILQKEGYPQKIVEMVRHHHENCDGSGYPHNLSREDIPYGARILRVSDVFVALTSDRPYRKAFDVETAMELMIEESRYYDLEVFLAFMRVIHGEDLQGIMERDSLETQIAEGWPATPDLQMLREWTSWTEDITT